MSSPNSTNASPTNVAVVIAAYNEAERLGAVLESLRSVQGSIGNSNLTVVVVDDGSVDATTDVARQGGAIVLRHILNRGQGAALQTGIDYAHSNGAEVVVTFDADGQHLAEDIPHVIRPVLAQECQVVLGSRFLGRAENIPTTRRWMLKLAIPFFRWSTGLNLTDTHNGFRAFSRGAVPKLRMTEDGMAHASEFLHRLAKSGCDYKEVPVTIVYTDSTLEKGQSNSAAIRVAFRSLVARMVG